MFGFLTVFNIFSKFFNFLFKFQFFISPWRGELGEKHLFVSMYMNILCLLQNIYRYMYMNISVSMSNPTRFYKKNQIQFLNQIDGTNIFTPR